MTQPSLVVVPAQDRIVPPASAAALATALPAAERLAPALGHIGMMVGSAAPQAGVAAARALAAPQRLGERRRVPKRGPGGLSSRRPNATRQRGKPMTEIVIAGAARTPVGSFNGASARCPPHDLGKVAIAEAMKRASVAPAEVTEVIMGQILAAGEGQNPARQAAVAAGIPYEVTAYGINQLCGSGLRSGRAGLSGDPARRQSIVVAGGQESMSQAPHCIHLRNGVKMGDAELVDTMIKDGLWDAFNGYHMGNTAENVAQRWQITREQQDALAARSQARAEAAQKAGRFKDEIVPVTIATRKGETVVDTDEYPKHGTTVESAGEAAPGLRQERHGHRGQRLGHQ